MVTEITAAAAHTNLYFTIHDFSYGIMVKLQYSIYSGTELTCAHHTCC